MAVSLKHAFVSPKQDGVDSTLVQPSNWNAEHTLTMNSGFLLGRATAGTGAVEEIIVGTGLVFNAGQLTLGGTVSITALTASGAVTAGSLVINGDPVTATALEINSVTTRVPDTRTITAGTGLSGGGSLAANRTIAHADTSTQSSVSNSGTTFIQSITLDDFGHVTNLASGTITPAGSYTDSQARAAQAAFNVGEVGSYAFLTKIAASGSRDYTAGTTLAGSSLRYGPNSAVAPSGTWRAMGANAADDQEASSVWLRIS